MKKITLLVFLIVLAVTMRAQNFEWAGQFGGPNAIVSAIDMVIDASGNVYTVGNFKGNVDFDPGPGQVILISPGYLQQNYEIFVTKQDAAGNLIWAKQMGGDDYELASSIAIDATGNIYITGALYGTSDFDPGSGVANLVSVGQNDIYIVKLTSSGDFVWVKQIGSPGAESTSSITIDASGNVLTTGSFTGTVDFDPGNDSTFLTTTNVDIFISKLNGSGTFIWAKQLVGTGTFDGPSEIVTDASGNVFTTGVFNGTVDFNPGSAVNNLTANDAASYINKLSSSGDYVWAKKIDADGPGGLERGYSIAVDASGNVYATGIFNVTVNFDPGVSNFSMTAIPAQNIYIAKYGGAGNFIWAKQLEGIWQPYNKSTIALDAAANVYVTDHFIGTIDLNPAALDTFSLTSVEDDYDAFICKLNTDGNFGWGAQIAGVYTEESHSIAIDADNNVYITGYFYGTADFDPGSGQVNLTSYGNDAFVLKLNQVAAPSIITSATSGNWSNPATWVGGVVPTATSQVIIAANNDILMDVSGVAKTLTIETGGTMATNGSLSINTAGVTLTIGDFNTGGGNDSVVVRGALNISNGALNIGGRLLQYLSPSEINHTGGIIRIDGNTGVAATSVADVDYLLHSLATGSGNYSFTGGQLVFIDPPIGATGNTMSWAVSGGKFLGTNSEIVFGDGVSTTAGGSGFKLVAAACGDIVVNNPSGTNRAVTNSCGQIQDLTITAGSFTTTSSLNILGTTVNNGTLSCTASAIDMQGGCTNSGAITASSNLLANDNVTNNAGASITAPEFYFTRNLTNNGSINVSTNFSCSRTITTNSSFAQVISGTGVFNTGAATLRIDNSNAAGVTVNTDLSVSKLSLADGNFYLGGNNITFNTLPVSGGDAESYIVTNGTGRLRFTNLTTSEVLFPIGTASTYNPVRINNGSGHTFSAGVQSGFTSAPPGTEHVNREWDIDDLTGGAVSVDVTLQWNTADEDLSFNRNLCAVAHYNGSIWHSLVAASTAANPSPDVYTSMATGVNSFSPFMVSSNSVVLPLNLISFTAQEEKNKVDINWKAELENNVSYYNLQRSIDGLQFSTLEKVNAVNRTGTHEYKVYDNAPVTGLNFYRLQIIDKDGQFIYSKTISVNFNGKPLLLFVSPNPAANEIIVRSANTITGINIINITGSVVKRFSPATNNRYNIQSLLPGIYFVCVLSANKMEVQKLIKE